MLCVERWRGAAFLARKCVLDCRRSWDYSWGEGHRGATPCATRAARAGCVVSAMYSKSVAACLLCTHETVQALHPHKRGAAPIARRPTAPAVRSLCGIALCAASHSQQFCAPRYSLARRYWFALLPVHTCHVHSRRVECGEVMSSCKHQRTTIFNQVKAANY